MALNEQPKKSFEKENAAAGQQRKSQQPVYRARHPGKTTWGHCQPVQTVAVRVSILMKNRSGPSLQSLPGKHFPWHLLGCT